MEKLIIKIHVYHKSEKFDNLFYDENNKVWKECDINNKIFECSKCPIGTFIKDNNSSKICVKCPNRWI